MVKFMLRIFGSCQTKHSSTSTPPEHPSPPSQRHKVITGGSPCTPSKQTPHRSSFKTHVSSACGSMSGNRSTTKDFQTHVVDKLYDVVSPRSKLANSATAGVVSDNSHRFQFPLLPVPQFYHRYKKDTHQNRPNKQPPEILSYPPRSFSDVGVRSRLDGGGEGGEVSPEWGSPARLSVFKKLMPCKVEGRVKESFAVVKRSEKPYEDFKKSMMEMIVENQIYEESDLKQLLQCFLSLNSWYHHGVIMEAFSEIWNTLFLDR